MKLIVGLGNPGEKYEKTRHNLGFMIVEHFLKDFQDIENTLWENSGKFKSDIAQIEWQRRSHRSGQASLEKVILVKPKTYMNNSGMAVRLVADFYRVNPSDIWVIHDDIDLPLGAMKIRFGGASAGHHGVESIIEHLGTDKFWRFRMGTGLGNHKSNIKDQKFRNVEDFVLSNFSGSEKGKLKALIKRGVKAIEESLEDGLDAAMNRFNTK
ncbi:MAG: aminoacyl-tRNA hydrolase [Candidatus Levybacteria bacterium RIFCSPLOWO2_01_FULL_39_24]|nr:MAG: aminoacyl-tRNA hydrolase [Candidatus Levybacteria bacterium RIFCSPHIGHO2_01_FULL_40_16]OGH27816.1 MAG: aminoacyl-tRNA hydrolase [Candidatus Levybacteria bacterium RIFCSPHIGHO2_12_FULL_39_9]OGH46091.1 MAG: aminoacyl-tRNA hydrolase [Candidatus Levybacteria bacterium RIFCSPLOWO2_01_FULL_39_24]